MCSHDDMQSHAGSAFDNAVTLTVFDLLTQGQCMSRLGMDYYYTDFAVDCSSCFLLAYGHTETLKLTTNGADQTIAIMAIKGYSHPARHDAVHVWRRIRCERTFSLHGDFV